MTKFIRVREDAIQPKNKQAGELLDFAKRMYKHEKFDQKTFMQVLSEQKGKNTALLNSKADPALTWNYYRPALWFYGSIDMFEDEVKLTPKLGSIDPYNRSSKGKIKSLSLMDELKMLEDRIGKDMARCDEINDILAKAAAAGITVTQNGGASDVEDAEVTELPEEPTDAEAAANA